MKVWPGLLEKDEYMIVLDTSNTPSFKWEGWGTSLCWWANFVGGLPEKEQQRVLDLLFDAEKGLGFTIVRYNIGGGAYTGGDSNLRPFADMPGFRPGGPSGPYVWAADARQRSVLLGARARGAQIFEAFSNSPPWWMTMSGSVTGNHNWGQDNLDGKYYTAFVDYLTEVVRYYQDEHDLHFDYLAPFNEPVEGWWNINRSKAAQEGCNFRFSSMRQVVLDVKRALLDKGLSTKLSVFDAWSFNTPKLLRLMDEPLVSAIDQVNVHTYINFVTREETARRKEVRQAVSSIGKRLWMSEYGPLNWNGNEWEVAVQVARHISLDINELQPSAWCYWQALEVPGSLWGLIQCLFTYQGKHDLQIRKQYQVLKHFSRFIRPGFEMLPTEKFADSLVAARDESGTSLVLVVTNTSSRSKDVSYSTGCVPRIASKAFQASVFRSSASEDFVQLPSLAFTVESPNVVVWIPPKSVTTLVVF
ncbi:endo-beta-1,6-galactanase isoform X2 [Selaginella moellendorffii]|nr:endo-beta-1,6-galactanase isoform X2 [Selaginella moellendorffii]|eukprot:XP_024533552.1 endo-beta-1,6-galactanase isoform X2 [Selaginella moellendorffii]